MDPLEFRRNYEVEMDYWWNIGRFEMIESFIRRHIQPPPAAKLLDLGCGTGGTTQWLRKFGEVKGVDSSRVALTYCRKRGLKDLLLSSLERLRLPSAKFDAAFALDILEHVEDDRKSLREIHRVLKPGAKLLVTAPAYQWLWSEHDEVCHHRRRYTLREMEEKIREAGFELERSSYCIVFLFFPLLAMIRFRSLFKRDRKIMMSIVPLPPFLNQIPILLLRLENFLLRFLDFPFGVSVLCLARKPALRKAGKRA